MRGISAGQLAHFFAEKCGDIIYMGEEDDQHIVRNRQNRQGNIIT